ncbi:type IX secretion system sortase PorU [Polaribacter sp. HaHaR_3_91]|uniref:type IX secretion system sortase PorU n=1 Tax=Polaribacter sp. HaHaR_3_91 TaxID=2745561 RepID=UPI001C4F5D6D|nr:type IX secretion system sortase PorU [Polaribacter sp. HaHaR_3_91]QXP64495.1 type IX secretion system sortase PorU [Polaribacter sp. HaHaR_3_91]
MKKQYLLLFFIFLVQVISAQTTNSVLSTGDWFKFSVDTTGVFKIDRSLLQQIGISTNGLNPKKISIYGNGGAMLPVLNSDDRFQDLQENAIYVEGEDDGSFGANDYILFYAQGPHDWEVDATNSTAKHRQNIYSDEAYYFITVSNDDGKRIQDKAPITTTATKQITIFDDYTFYEKEERNLIAAGTQWFSNTDFNIENTQNFKIPFPNAVSGANISVAVRGVSTSISSSSMAVNVNGQDLYSLNFSPANTTVRAYTSERTGNIVNSADFLEVSISYNNNGNPSATAFLDYIEIVGKKELIAAANQFSFRSFEQANSAGAVEYRIENNSTIFQVWEVSDHVSPKIIQNNSTDTSFTFIADGGTLAEYQVLNPNDYYTPKALQNGRIANQNLHALKDLNYVVITNTELSSEAQRLADYHQENSGLITKVIILDDIYNEFSSGAKDITGIRDFLKHLYNPDASEENKLKYVCFFGDASYDYKDRITGNNNIVPIKLSDISFNLATSWVTDDFYVMLDEHEGTMNPTIYTIETPTRLNHTIDVASSRIPVSTLTQAKDVVNKILSYYDKSSLGDWRNTITMLADDIDNPSSDASLQPGLDRIAESIKTNKPSFNINKIYADAFVQENSSGGERYPEVNEAITNAIEKGTLIFDYFGHGGEDGFAEEKILDKAQIQGFNNPNTLPLLITITCDFSRFDNPNRITAGELTLWNTSGGAASMITTTREVYISTGQTFNEDLIKVLLEYEDPNIPENLSISEVLTVAKNRSSSSQKFFIFSFGDPAMKLAIPKPSVRITKMNEKDITSSIDTLKALSKVSFEGVVVDELDAVLTDFNGSLSTVVYDKVIEKSTLANDGNGSKVPFDTQDSKLFRGKSTVTNGVFKFDFVVPKDVKIAYGKGKISFYAENGVLDKAGANFDVIVGGINDNAPDDTVGPEIKLYMNDESFIDGGNTNASPNLVAVLVDASGINTSITAVDHDIVGVLDGDTTNPIILNDFYETELDDFTKGKVTYKLRDLEVGPHTLKIKAWDTYNNSSELTLNFVVVSDAVLNLENVLNYPNPFVNYTEFWFNHNKPNESLDVQVQIFTVSGKLVKTINQNIPNAETLVRSVSWNGLDDFGNKIGKGVYVYKLKVKATSSNLISEKYEKLVILQ